MINRFKFCRVLVFFFTFLLFPVLVHAALPIPSVKEKATLAALPLIEAIDKTTDDIKFFKPERFFNSLEPRNFEIGAVKTFAVTVIDRYTRSNRKTSNKVEPKAFGENITSRQFLRPVLGNISSYFGYRSDPYRRRRMTFHAGIDIPARTGTPIKSAKSGVVVYTGWRHGYGLMVEIDHGNGISTVYAHCSKIYLKVGQKVNQGQIVGAVGRTGSTTGAHLHFEVRRRGVPVNPMRYLAQ